jgi:hypothetical protein
MRVSVLAGLTLLGLTGGALTSGALIGQAWAQTSIYTGAPAAPHAPGSAVPPSPGELPPPPGGYPVPPGYPAQPAPAPSAAVPPGGMGVPGGLPAGANPVTGARPGNEIGTGQSLPLSSQASNIDGATTRSPIAPRLPTPTAGDDATIRQYLMNARDALAAGRTGEGQEALERAETRMLDRSVAPEQVRDTIHGPGIEDVSAARRALAGGNVQAALQVIDAALARR